MAHANGAQRLGRPPATSSAETRGRIIDVSRRCFAQLGYEATSNRAIASEAGITTGAIYHYFDSKQDIYRAVYREVQDRVYQNLGMAERGASGFLGKINAVLDAAALLNREDPTLAQFLGAARTDRSRIPELDDHLAAGDRERNEFLRRIIDEGVESGEIAPEDQRAIAMFLNAFMIGLVDGMSHDEGLHRDAIRGFRLALETAWQPDPRPR